MPLQHFPALYHDFRHIVSIQRMNMRRIMLGLLKIHTNDNPVKICIISAC